MRTVATILETRHQSVTKTKAFYALLEDSQIRKSKAGKGFWLLNLIIDTVEVWGSSPHGPTIRSL